MTKKVRPSNSEELLTAIEVGDIDGRTRTGRALRDIKKSVKSNFDCAAVQILEEDLAVLIILQRLIAEQLLKNPKEVLDKKGNCSPALNAYLRFQTASKSALLALKKFSEGKPPAKGLADLIREQSEGEPGRSG